MIGEILIGFGIVTQLAGWATQQWIEWDVYVGFFMTLFAASIYIWGVLKWNDVRE